MSESWWLSPSRLDKKQREIMDLDVDSGSHVVVGPPGSGKTNILALRAQYLIDSDLPDVVVLMFTRSLRDWVAQGAATYRLDERKVMTFVAWISKILNEHGVKVPTSVTNDFPKLRKFLATALKKLLDTQPNLEQSLDCILVDEVQDALPEEIDLFFRMGRRVFLVGDDGQQIYDTPRGTAPNAIFSHIGARATRHDLEHHYRNGRKICLAADATKPNGTMAATSNYVEDDNPSAVQFIEYASEDAQLDALIKRLREQSEAYKGELLAVCVPTNDLVNRVLDALLESDIAELVFERDGGLFDPDKPDACIFVGTMHAAKGLEFRTMHLPYIDEVGVFFDKQRRLSYTAITRAKTLLDVSWVAPKRLPPHLDAARAVCKQPRVRPADWADVFPTQSTPTPPKSLPKKRKKQR